VALLGSPRATFINLSYLDEDSCTKDFRLIELTQVQGGADVFVRNPKGKTVYEGSVSSWWHKSCIYALTAPMIDVNYIGPHQHLSFWATSDVGRIP
jgi:hypothetical protein